MPTKAPSIERLSLNVYGLTDEMTPIIIPKNVETIKDETASSAVAGKVSIIVVNTSRLEE